MKSKVNNIICCLKGQDGLTRDDESIPEDIPCLDQLHDQVLPGEIMSTYDSWTKKYRGREHERPTRFRYMDWNVWTQASGGYKNGRIRGIVGNLIIREDYEDVSHGAKIRGSQPMPRQEERESESLTRQQQLDRDYHQHEAELLELPKIQTIVESDPTWLSRMKKAWYSKRPL